MDENMNNEEPIERLKFTPIKGELEDSFIKYAMEVNVSRAIPDVRDGLKPVHRRILYAMGESGLFNDKPYRKCATVVGDVMGHYHPHGDSSIYDALVRLAQDFSINAPLIDGHGNFGSVDGDSAAAMRYTECRMSKIGGEMLRDIDKETVDFYPTFDDSGVQPVSLPSRFPNILVNGSDGIAVGMATNIPPHNLAEACNATIAYIDNPNITLDEIMQIMPAPDFPSRGFILGHSGIRKAYETGKGTFIIRGRAEIEESPSGKTRIIVTEIPYQVIKSQWVKNVADHVRNKKIEGISDIRDESGRNGMRVVIDIKRDFNAQVVLNQLYKHTELQVNFGMIMLALVGKQPKILPLLDVLKEYVTYQQSVITRRTQYDLNKAEQHEHILLGLLKALEDIDAVIKVIKASSDKADACNNLMTNFDLSDKQANAILEMRLQKLTSLEIDKVREDLAAVQAEIAEYHAILADPKKVDAIIKADLSTIKEKYGVPRKTEMSIDYGDIDIADLIPRETVVITLSHEGYIKRMPASEYKSQHRGGVGVITHKTKEEDFVEDIYITNSHDLLLCFSSSGRVYTMRAYEVPESTKNSKGRAFVNLLNLSAGERITAIIPASDEQLENNEGYLMMATSQGLIKKTDVKEFARINRNGKIAIHLLDDDRLISVQYTTGNDEIIMASSTGKCIRFHESAVRSMGRDTKGVKSMHLDPGEYIVDMAKILPDHYMLTISEYGYGKRTSPDDYRLQGRAGKGIKAGVFTDETGGLVNLKQVSDNDDIMIIADDGTAIRVKSTEISIIGRNTKGVRIMKLKKDCKIVCVAVAPSEDDEKLEQELEEKIEQDEESSTAPQTSSDNDLL